jgi:hypothetical protein
MATMALSHGNRFGRLFKPDIKYKCAGDLFYKFLRQFFCRYPAYSSRRNIITQVTLAC